MTLASRPQGGYLLDSSYTSHRLMTDSYCWDNQLFNWFLLITNPNPNPSLCHTKRSDGWTPANMTRILSSQLLYIKYYSPDVEAIANRTDGAYDQSLENCYVTSSCKWAPETHSIKLLSWTLYMKEYLYNTHKLCVTFRQYDQFDEFPTNFIDLSCVQ